MTKTNAKAKLSLTAAPTFKAPVTIQIPGGGEGEVIFTFKHRTKTAFREFFDNLSGREDKDVLLDIASGWDLEAPFDADSIEQMIETHMNAPQAVISVYVSELMGARTKN